MANENTIKKMRDYVTHELSVIDQNGYYRRNPDGTIKMQKDADGKNTPFPVSKQGIIATQERLTLRNKAAKRKYNNWPDDKYYPKQDTSDSAPAADTEDE